MFLPLDDLLAITREFICTAITRSGRDRCLRRHGTGNLSDFKPQQPKHALKALKSYEPRYMHLDVKYPSPIQDETSWRYQFVPFTGPRAGVY